MSLKAILFDAADTLFRVRGSVGAAYATAAARHGVTVAAADIEGRFRSAFGRMPPLAFPGAPAAELPQLEYAWWKQVVTAVFAGTRVDGFDAFFADLFEYFARGDSWELFADTEPALAALRERGLRLAIVSNFDGRLTRICASLGIAGYFETIVMSGRIGAAKPDAGIFTVALQRLGVSASEAAHVGDSPREDVDGARSAGLTPILVARDTPASGANVVSDLREIQAF
ncbi:MAG TPA: HAD-IA family hydrolase [Candidatus Margulisiibacteriota bacterium]|nr:HAD-IA family hydrolase [Candidatus Margulisiibacteriota bacterium]